MSTPPTLDEAPLVGVSAAENTFVVPKLETIAPTSAEVSTADAGYHVEPSQVFERDTLLVEQSIQVGDTPFVNLLGDFDPFYEYLNNPLIKSYTEPFGQVRFDLILTCRLIAPGSCYGTYNIQCLAEGGRVPTGTVEQDAPIFDAYPNSTQDAHAFMNVELKNDVIFELPWVHYQDSYRLGDLSLGPSFGPRCWRLLIWALSPIQSTLGTTAAGRIQVYARMERRSFENLAFQAKKTSTTNRHPVAQETRQISGFLDKASKSASLIGGLFPSIAPMALPTSVGLAAASTIADMFGFTRESDPRAPQPVLRRLASSLAHIDGIDTGEVVGLSIANALTIDPGPGGGEAVDPMSFASLYERWTIINIFSMSELSTGVLQKVPVTPMIYETILGAHYLTTGGYVGLPFAMWRGGMEYMVYIPSSPNLQGSIQVLWDPDFLATGVYPQDPTNRLTNVVIDLKGSSRTMLSVDYSQPLPCLPTHLVQAGGLSSGANGTLIFRVNAPLSAPRTGTYDVKVIIMARPKQNMKFGGPRSEYLLEGAGPRFVEDVEFQAGSDVVEETPVSMIELAKSSPYPVSAVLWGEEIQSVRALCQHYTPAFKLAGGLGVLYDTIGWPHFIPPPQTSSVARWAATNGVAGKIPFTYFGWYTSVFTGVRGSSNVKFYSESSDQRLIYPAMPGQFLGGGAEPLRRGYPGLMIYDQQPLTPTIGAEARLPAYSQLKYWPVRAVLDATVACSTGRFDFTTNLDNGTFDGYFAYAGGPDMTVTRFRRLPAVFFL